eukprot:403367392
MEDLEVNQQAQEFNSMEFDTAFGSQPQRSNSLFGSFNFQHLQSNLHQFEQQQDLTNTSYGSSVNTSFADQQEARMIFNHISQLDFNKLKQTLDQLEHRKSLEIVNLFDENGQTVLHAASYYNSFKIFEYLISFFRVRLALYLKQKLFEKYNLPSQHVLDEDTAEQIKNKVRNAIKEWINIPSRSDEGVYPIHFAAFHGNPRMIKLMVKIGADITVRSKLGINLIHVSAQGDQAYSLVYFKNRGLSIHQKDCDSSTALHWACFGGSDTALYYLLAWNIDINAQEANGNTCLHQAIKRASHFPSTRSIKELLIKGADPNIKNFYNQRPIDLVQDIQNLQLREELYNILSRETKRFQLCQFKQPLRKIEKSKYHMLAFLFLIISTFFLMLVNIFPYIKYQEWIVLIFIVFVTTLIFFTLSALYQPGFLEKPDKQSFEKLLEVYDPNILCPTCEVMCRKDSRHCFICNKCVNHFDHHCVWINNCIGENNHTVFYLFILSLDLYLIINIIMTFLFMNISFTPEFFSKVKQNSLLSDLITRSPQTAQVYYYTTMILVLTLSSIFIAPLTLMVVVQTQNLIYNSTTNKRFSKLQSRSHEALIGENEKQMRQIYEDHDNEEYFTDVNLGTGNNWEEKEGQPENQNLQNVRSSIMESNVQTKFSSNVQQSSHAQRNCLNTCCKNNQNFQTNTTQEFTYYGNAQYNHESRSSSSKSAQLNKILYETSYKNIGNQMKKQSEVEQRKQN